MTNYGTRPRLGPTTSSAQADSEQARGPIIVLSYEHAGAELLSEVLSASKSVVCTSGTGVVPLCLAVARTWNQAQNRAAAPSALALASIRALVGGMISVIQAGAGAPRWCETAFALPDAAEIFLAAFPATTFLCLHRNLHGVLAEGLKTYPWGLGQSPFWAYSTPHPGNNVATIATYWTARTEALLGFEAKFERACLRIRYEDLAADCERRSSELYAYLGLGVEARLRCEPQRPTAGELAGGVGQPLLPDAHVPAHVIEKANELHASLGYPPLVTGAGRQQLRSGTGT